MPYPYSKGEPEKQRHPSHLAAALAQLGAKVLLVDLDQQASATHHLGLDPEVENPNLYHVFKSMVPASTAIKELPFGFCILTGHSLLAAIEEALEEGDEGLLREKLEGLKHDYDYIILDSPPGKSQLAFNAMSAADEVIIPLSAERPVLDGVEDLIRFIKDVVWESYNPSLKIRGICRRAISGLPRMRQASFKKPVKCGAIRSFRLRCRRRLSFLAPTIRACRCGVTPGP